MASRKASKIPSSQLSIFSFWKIFHSFLKMSTGSGKSSYIQWIISWQIFNNIPVWDWEVHVKIFVLLFCKFFMIDLEVYFWSVFLLKHLSVISFIFFTDYKTPHDCSLCYSSLWNFSMFWLRDMAKYFRIQFSDSLRD